MAVMSPEIQAFVRQQRLGFVATVCPDGTPNLSPKGTTTVWDASRLAFADICSPQTRANLLENPAVEVNVVDVLSRRGYRFKGRASVHESGPDHRQGLEVLAREGFQLHPERVRAIVVVELDAIGELLSPAYDAGAREPELRARWTAHYLGTDAA